jgi:hypothetical protein
MAHSNGTAAAALAAPTRARARPAPTRTRGCGTLARGWGWGVGVDGVVGWSGMEGLGKPSPRYIARDVRRACACGGYSPGTPTQATALR